MTFAKTYCFVTSALGHGAQWRRRWTAVFFAFLFVVSVIPGRLDIQIDLLGVPVRVLEFMLVAFAVMLVFSQLQQGSTTSGRETGRRGAPDRPGQAAAESSGTGVPGLFSGAENGHVLAVFSGLFAYAALSLLWWSPVEEPDTAAMAWTLVLSASSLWVAYLVVRSQRHELRRFMSNLTTFIAITAAAYSAQSFLNLGFRSEGNATPDPTFGIDRVRGPLFGASLGGVILIPALAFALQEVIVGRNRRRNALVSIALLVACLGTGSRATVLGLGVMLALGTFSLRSTRQRLAFGSAVAIVGVLIGWLVVSTERLASMEDATRAMTIETGVNAIAEASITEKILGLGYASYWPWYLLDAKGEGGIMFEGYFETRPAGITLYHPHSTLLLLPVELGVPGVAAGLALAWAVWRARRSAAEKEMPTIVFAGLAGAVVTIATDLVIFKAPFLNLIWWSYVFGAIALAHPTGRSA